MNTPKPFTRSYTVTLSQEEAEHLRTFDNKKEGKQSLSIRENHNFYRKNEKTFMVKRLTDFGIGNMWATTTGRATFINNNQLQVTIKNTGLWLGALIIIAGLTCIALTPKDGIWAAIMGIVLVAIGWLAFFQKSTRKLDLDDVEKTMRSELSGEWQEIKK